MDDKRLSNTLTNAVHTLTLPVLETEYSGFWGQYHAC